MQTKHTLIHTNKCINFTQAYWVLADLFPPSLPPMFCSFKLCLSQTDECVVFPGNGFVAPALFLDLPALQIHTERHPAHAGPQQAHQIKTRALSKLQG